MLSQLINFYLPLALILQQKYEEWSLCIKLSFSKQKLTQILESSNNKYTVFEKSHLVRREKNCSNRLSFSRNYCSCKHWVIYRNHNIFHKSFLNYWSQNIHIYPLCTCSIQLTVSFCASNWGTLFNFSRSVNTLTAFKAELPIPLQRRQK